MGLPIWISLGAFAVGYLSTAYVIIEVLRLRTLLIIPAGMIGGIIPGVAARYLAEWLLR